MFNQFRLREILAQYKQIFVPERWDDEKFKWEAVKWFQDNWDVNAVDFADMLSRALSKTFNLLVSANNFPRRMIVGFAKAAPEEVRAMFIDLFDESKDVFERMSAFKLQSSVLLERHGNGAVQHYQYENAISTYLWLRYPDKYYIYRFGEVKSVASELESDYKFRKGAYADNVRSFLRLYDEISEALKQDSELVNLLRSQLTETCYPDPELKTLTIDVGFYISRKLFQSKQVSNTEEDDTLDGSDPSLFSEEWFPPLEEYAPGFTKEKWLKLLNNKKIIGPVWGGVLAAFYEVGGAATCAQIAQKYNRNASSISGNCTQLAKRIYRETQCPLSVRENGKNRYWPILFQGKKADSDAAGGYMWKLRPELYEALTEFGIMRYQWKSEEEQTLEKEDGSLENLTGEENLLRQEDKAIIYGKADFLNEVYMTEESYESLVAVLKNKKNIILQGAPGVGKTFAARRLAWSMMGEMDDSRIEFVQFHQNYSYEDFVMGYKPAEDGFELKYGIFYRFCQKAANQPDKEFFFIIDEINRGNTSKIFGELLMLIEKDYRGTKATLAYNGLSFAVPKNLYIIGMMNTADRSLAMIDYALRRRFSFYDMEPGFNSDGFIQYQNGLNNETLNELVERIKELNREIAMDKSLGKGFCIGHSYFCGCDVCTDEWLHAVVNYDILPMLSEYWFDEPGKLQRWENNLRGVFQ